MTSVCQIKVHEETEKNSRNEKKERKKARKLCLTRLEEGKCSPDVDSSSDVRDVREAEVTEDEKGKEMPLHPTNSLTAV